MTAARDLGRALGLVRAVELSDRTDAIVSLLARAIQDIVTTSPDDQAEIVANIARTMRREKP